MKRRDLLIVLGLALLAALFFAPVVFGGRTLVPFDDLYRFPPWSAFAAQLGVTTPHNELVLDLLVENYAWKQFILQTLQQHEIPLWNPYLFAGVPFLAAGQHSALYPFSLLFYVLPVAQAYGYFVALQIALAAITMYWFARVLGLSRLAAVVSGIVYAFSGFMVVSTTFPMVISAAAWLPAILACVEHVVHDAKLDSGITPRQLFFALVGAILTGVQFLAGHVEISIYILIVTAFYALTRGFAQGLKRTWRGLLLTGAMTGVGATLAAVQLVPLFELVQNNFRSGSVTYDMVVGWAYQPRQLAAFLMPDFFGNPTHHSYFDVFDFAQHAAPNGTIFWGLKNYVEAGSYVGILPIALALIAAGSLLAGFGKKGYWKGLGQGFRPSTLVFTALAVISLLFAFGTPLYALLFFGVPGFNQLHSPFRWVFPYTLSMAVLAGIGIQILSDRIKAPARHVDPLRLFGWAALVIGGVATAALSLSLLVPGPTLGLAQRLFKSSNMAQATFGTARAFYSYEFRNVLLLALFVLGTGIVLLIARRGILLPTRLASRPAWQPLALLLVVADLFVIGIGFYPAVDPKLADLTPPSVQFLQEDKSLYRITTYDARGAANEKVMNPNTAMLYGIPDIRGYDSIIPKQYADLMGLLAPQDELLDNRIASFYDPDPLSSPLVNLLNVKYVLTKRPLPNPGYTLVYDKEIRIYRNDHALPRAFMVPRARVIPDRAALLNEMKRLDPTGEVLIEEQPGDDTSQVSAVDCTLSPVTVDTYLPDEVTVKSKQDCGAWLVLSDSYFPGWIAYLDGSDTPMYRADYNFRAVYVPAGEHAVRFKYSPVSFRVGGIGSFLAGMLLLMGFAYLAWRRFYHVDEDSQVQVVAKNSLLPMGTSLLMKLADLAFALFSLRILGPTAVGRYAWAVGLWLIASTISDFGLGILLTREVSRDRSQANRYLANSAWLRLALWGLSLVPFGAIAAIYIALFHVTFDAALAFGLLLLGMLPSSLSASLAFLFNAYERFEYRVAVDVATRIISITLGVIVLLLGYGIVGLAAVSIATNMFTLTAFYLLVRRTLFVPRLEMDRPLIRWMVFESYPFMINNLLSNIFFRIDTMILLPLKGDTILGYYSTAYKFIDALNFIPSNFTLAIFPALSRMAATARDGMLRAYVLSLKILLWISLPITVGTIFVAHDLISISGGSAYLPDSAIALQVLIFFLPFSFVNSVTHYVLIALGQQRFLTKAFIVGVVFNILANLIAIQQLSYVGAALVTILSEIVLLVPFYYSVRKHLATIPFASIAWRPVVASALMGLGLWWMVSHVGLVLAVPIAGTGYLVMLIALGALGEEERLLLRRLLPVRVQKLARLAG